MRLRRLILVAFVNVAFVGATFAQSPNGTISGTVLDPTGKLIAGAEITVMNDATRAQYLSKTNNEGLYVVQSLPPGQYRLQVAKIGFKTLVKPDIVLNVQDALAINFTLPIGAAAETVTVRGGASLVNTQDATVSTVVDRQFAENLPMNGRSFQTLIELTPGVVFVPSNPSDGGQFSINGQRAASNYWMVDGVGANIGIGMNVTGIPGNGLGGSVGSFGAMGGTNSLVSVDAMQEFRIETSTYSPEFGRTPGGQISIATRSGTDQFHGTVFDYVRNDAFDANNWFADANGLAKPEERQNDFGGTLGGPVLKDRTFFFFSYEGLRLRLPQTELTTVPDLSARQNATAAMQPYLNAYPKPNGEELGNGIATFDASFSNRSALDAYSLRIDHKVNSSLTLFGRYNYSPSNLVQRGASVYSANTLNSTGIDTQTATGGITWSASPQITNDLRFNYSRTSAASHYYMDDFGGAVPLASLPFPSPFTAQDGLFFFLVLPLEQGFLKVGQLGQNLQRQINIVDSLSLQKRSHSLKLGIDFRRLSPEYRPQGYELTAAFGDVPSTESGNLLESAALSELSTTFLFRNLGVYAQDTWHILPRLAITYGLRWDLDLVPRSTNGPDFPAVTGFSLSNLSNLALAPAGTPPYKTTYGNIAPRLGLAYQLSQAQDWQRVLRGGIGVFYDLASSEAGNNVALGYYPFGSVGFSGGGTFPLNPAALTPPPISSASLISGILYGFDPNLKLPYTLEWNVAVEQGIGKQQTVSASYLGAAGRRLLATAYANSPDVNFGQALLVSNGSSSSYNALQLQFQRRLSAGFQALVSYTWSHSIDTGSAGSNFLVSNSLVPSGASVNRGPSDFDIRDALSAGLTYDVPTPRANALAKTIFGGWSTENFVLIRTAPPVDISDANFFQFSDGYIGDVRPDLIPGQTPYLYGAEFPGGKAFDPTAFTDPPVDPTTGFPLRQGDVPRNFLRGFGASQWDFAVHREFPIHEALRLQFRAEMFNVLNHPNFGQPSGLFGFPGFGLSNQTLAQSLNNSNLAGGAFSPLYQIGGPRSIQLALKVLF